MAMAKSNMSSFATHMRNSLPSLMLRQRSNSSRNTPTCAEQSIESRPKRPIPAITRFMNRNTKDMWSEIQKEAIRSWEEMSEEDKRPYVEEHAAANERWLAERASIKSRLQAMEVVDNRGETKNHYSGFCLFRSEVQVPSDPLLDFVSMTALEWNELSPEEREAYNERAREMNGKGQGELISTTLHNINGRKKWARPVSASLRFRNEFLSTKLRENMQKAAKEWAELSVEERDQYVKPFMADLDCYRAEMVKYKAGKEYVENKRKRAVVKASIRKIEEELNMPRLLAGNVFHLFWAGKRETLKGKSVPGITKAASVMWQALSEEEKMDYTAKWNNLKADWEREVAEWERRYADNPKLTELKAYRQMLKTVGRK